MTLYASTAQIKAALRISDTVDDPLISMAGSAACELIDNYCGRTFGTASATRYYAPTDQIVCQIDDLAGTAVTIQTSSAGNGQYDQTWTTTDYQLEPLNSYSDGMTLPFTRIRAIGAYWFPTIFNSVTVKVTGTFGYPSVPASVTQAAVMQSARIFKRLDSPLGVAGFGDMGAMRVTRSVDPDVAVLLDPYKRMHGIA
jgi:hypothetical protein